MKKTISIVMIIIVLIFACSTYVFADEVTDSMKDGWNSKKGMSELFGAGGKILGVVQVVGTAVSLIMLIILAIKYMLSSPNEKADIKSKLTPYFIGAILIFGGSNILGLIQSIAKNI